MTSIRICDVVVVKDGHQIHKEYDGTLTRWRVESYLKKAKKPRFKESQWLDEILYSGCQECGPDKKRLVWCSQEEAQYVSLVGVCGSIARVKDCRVVGRVPWTEEHIKQKEDSAKSFIGQMIF